MIYVGGTLVLVVFGGMLTAGGPYASFPIARMEWMIGGLVSLGLFGLLVSTSLELGRKMLNDSGMKIVTAATIDEAATQVVLLSKGGGKR